jgi:hypothetical protein
MGGGEGGREGRKEGGRDGGIDDGEGREKRVRLLEFDI